MRIVMISFDSLEYERVKKYNCNILMQKEYGKIDLEPYLTNRPRGRGSGEPFTPEVYATFITGIVPKDYGHMKKEFDKLYGTIFKLASKDKYGRSTALAVDVPAYHGNAGKAWIEKLTGFPLFTRYWKDEIPLDRMEEEYYKYMDIKASYADLINTLGYDLVLFYFKEPDKLQHIYYKEEEYEPNIKRLYKKMEEIAEHIIHSFSDKETLIIIFSDHGMNSWGAHTSYGFWSSNIPLGRGKSIKVTDWYGLIKEWHGTKIAPTQQKPQDEVYEDSEKQKIIDRLAKLGYLE